MAEYTREVRFSIYVDTNKATYGHECESINDLAIYCRELVDDGILSAELGTVFTRLDNPEEK